MVGRETGGRLYRGMTEGDCVPWLDEIFWKESVKGCCGRGR